MAEIQTPRQDSSSYTRSPFGDRPTAAAIVTAIAGIWTAYNGFILFIVGNYIPEFSFAMMVMGIGISNVILGFLNIIAGYSVYNLKASGKVLGILANIIIIVLNIIIMGIGLMGFVLCFISIILLLIYHS